MSRNVQSRYTNYPTPHYPRTRFNIPPFRNLTSLAIGKITPIGLWEVYPGDTFDIKLTEFLRMDTSAKVPFDTVFCDTYFFWVPFRIIDKDNWAKVLGDRDGPLDTSTYTVPFFKYFPQLVTGGTNTSIADNVIRNNLPFRLKFSAAKPNVASNLFFSLSCYPIWTYWKIINHFFLDENVDTQVDYTSLGDGDTGYNDNPLLLLAAANKFHDYFTSGVISPQKGPEVLLSLNNLATVKTIPLSDVNLGILQGSDGLFWAENAGGTPTISTTTSARTIAKDTNGETFRSSTEVSVGSNPYIYPANLAADLSTAGITINNFRLAMMTQVLYERRSTYGSRYDEVLRGSWGLEIPTQWIDEPEYLGGMRNDLNNVPVLDTTTSGLGTFSGNSATLANGGSVFKSFMEYGYIMALAVPRIKHTYGQGKHPLWTRRSMLDFYDPAFANLGFQAKKEYQLYNQPDGLYEVIDGVNIENDSTFNFDEAWPELRSYNNEVSGVFNPLYSVTEYANKWTYVDIYGSAPVFSETWLKEDPNNVKRTLTGKLIAEAADTTRSSTQAIMANFVFHITKTSILPAHSVPASLIGRL